MTTTDPIRTSGEEPIGIMDERDASVRTPWPMILIAVATAAILALVSIASRVVRGDPFAFDRAVMLALRMPGDPGTPVGGAALASAVRDVTALGSMTVLTMAVVVTIAFLLLGGLWRTAILIGVATAGGAWTVTLFKSLVGRARPDIVGHLMHEPSLSFPSGHAANAAIIYFTIATLFLPVVRGAGARAFVICVATLLVGAIGASRVYLGVHWPSDVLAGWIFGLVWALAWWRIEIGWLRGRAAR